MNFRLKAKSPPKLKDLINTKIDPFSHLLYSGVYEIPFIYRNSLKRSKYIRETVKSLKIRIQEYVGGIKFDRRRTALSRENFQENIVILFNKAKIIYKSQLKLQNVIRESLEKNN